MRNNRRRHIPSIPKKNHILNFDISQYDKEIIINLIKEKIESIDNKLESIEKMNKIYKEIQCLDSENTILYEMDNMRNLLLKKKTDLDLLQQNLDSQVVKNTGEKHE